MKTAMTTLMLSVAAGIVGVTIAVPANAEPPKPVRYNSTEAQIKNACGLAGGIHSPSTSNPEGSYDCLTDQSYTYCTKGNVCTTTYHREVPAGTPRVENIVIGGQSAGVADEPQPGTPLPTSNPKPRPSAPPLGGVG